MFVQNKYLITGQGKPSNSTKPGTGKTAEINFRKLLSESPNAIFIANPLGKLLVVNNGMKKLTGFTNDDLLKKGYNDFILNESGSKKRLNIISPGKGKTIVLERVMKLKNGKLLDVELTAKFLSTGNMIVFLKDITESKKSRQQLLENEKRLIRAEKMGNLGHGFYNLENQTMNISEGLYRILGVKAKIFSHTIEGLRKLIHPGDNKIIKTAIYTLQTSGKVEIEFRIIQPSGNIRNVLFKTALVKNAKGKPLNCFTTAIDITEQKKVTAEKQALLHRYEQTMNTIFAGFILTDAKGKILQVNPAYLKITGYNKAELFKKNIHDIEINEEKKHKTINNKQIRYETRHRKKNKDIIDLEVRESIMPGIDGPLTALFVIDITQKKKAQQQIENYNKKLNQLTNHLQSVREEERRRIGREIHDDLGQQLTAIKMDIAWIDKKIPEEAILLKQKIKNIISLLDGSNSSVRRILHELKPSILDEYGLHDALELLGHQFTANTGIPIKILINKKVASLSEETITCIFRFTQESLTNITKYAKAKNVNVTIKNGNKKVSAIIEDDGTGFDTAILEGKDSFGLMGIQERVKALNGYFIIKSIIGLGTLVKISLPTNNN